MPKFLVNDDGTLGRRNDYFVSKIEEKMGLHGSATCVVNMGDNNDCYAELLGEERQGMRIMFQMMNEARIGTGMQAFAGGSAAYLHALQYAKERKQGSSLAEMKNPAAPRVAIIEHPDVRRMLLWMKAQIEGMRALLYYGSYLVDKENILSDGAEKDKCTGILEVLTPICKAYCSEMAFRVTEVAMQIYGGYGYCAEYPIEQFMRDVKITSLYEGTNGIQSLDLAGRKLGMKKGLYFISLIDNMTATVAETGEKRCTEGAGGRHGSGGDVPSGDGPVLRPVRQGRQTPGDVRQHLSLPHDDGQDRSRLAASVAGRNRPEEAGGPLPGTGESESHGEREW